MVSQPLRPLHSSDILFLSPLIISGDENEQPYVADVLVSQGRIHSIGESLSSTISQGVRRVNARGKVLCPGFIDLHAHSDLHVLTDPLHEPKITQGITTEVVGQDGISYYPTRKPEEMAHIRAQIAGWNGNPTDECCQSGALKGVGMFEWMSVKDYLDCLDRNKIPVNVAVLVPQGNLRLLAVGPNDELATDEQLKDQAELLKTAMLDGAVGMSSGLTYTPGMYASYHELAHLCRELGESFPGAIYAPHHRSYGKNALEAYGEMLALGRETGVPIHLTHCKLNHTENIGKAGELLEMIDTAIEDGVKVTLDSYPYTPGSTTLSSLLPSWANQGGPIETLERLKDSELRSRIQHEMEGCSCDASNKWTNPIEWDTVEFAGIENPELSSYVGKTISKLSEETGKEPIDLFYEVLEKDELRTSILAWTGDEDCVRTIMQHKTHTGGSDGIIFGTKVHPRAWGTFPRFVGHYARDLAIMPMQEMVCHLSSRAAKVLNIYPERGSVSVGAVADLVLFDPATIRDLATYEEPKTRSEGIDMVLVNGVVALDGNKLTGARSGVTLRRRKDGKVTGKGL
ncbi:Metallo-dependent hydrolase [Meredithblackwellia eburnea MCA 4105]